MVALILGAKFTFAFMVPDVPDEVNIQLERQDFIISKVLYDAVDDFDAGVLRRMQSVGESCEMDSLITV